MTTKISSGPTTLEKSRRLLVGAHYDVAGDQPGADDNASAVAGLLESARMVAQNKPDIDYQIDFVSYCLEEPPYYGTVNMGSLVHAESVKLDKQRIIGLINFEMIGYFHEGKQDYPSPLLARIYPQTANFIAVVGATEFYEVNVTVHQLMKSAEIIDVQMIDDQAVTLLASMSDRRNYWPHGIPALMINDTSSLRNPHYHQATDDIDTLNFDYMTRTVSACYRAITGLGQ